MPKPQPLLVITTLPDADAAAELATALVEARLAACVNVSAPLTSIYRWQESVERGSEVMLTLKTTAAHYAALETRIRAAHPYELPELIAVPITQGLPEYIDWIESCVRD